MPEEPTAASGIARESQDAHYRLSVLLKLHAAWFYLAAFPSFILVFSHGSCVSFQGVSPAVDFIAVQVLFLAVFSALAAPRVLERPRYVRFLRIAIIVNLAAQVGALGIHSIGLAFDGSLLDQTCFEANLGGIWYTLVANLGGAVLFVYLLISINNLASLQRS